MKDIIFMLAFICLLVCCCKSPVRNETPAPETPKALQENNSKEFDVLSKGSYDRGEDLVQKLYEELANKSDELKGLEKQIDYLDDLKSDSLKSFNNFNQKNTAYYSTVDQHVKQISDSVLRVKIKSLLQSSQNDYTSKIKNDVNLISALNSKEITLRDLHIILKIVKTLPLIEKYQMNNIPPAKPIENVTNEFDKTIKKLGTLANK